MTRAFSRLLPLATWFVIIAGAGAGAWAGNKPKVAILGLEVIHGPSGIDQASTVVARDITEGLRRQALTGIGPLTLAPGSDKELIDEKLMKGCGDEDTAKDRQCMAEIGKDLKADFLMFGRIEKDGDRGYRVTVQLLNVNKRGQPKIVSKFIPMNEVRKGGLEAWTKEAYGGLTGKDMHGTLIVRANVDHGTVLINDKHAGTLTSNTLTLTLDPGRYRLAIEVEGYKPWAGAEITIGAGEKVDKEVELEPLSSESGTRSVSSGGEIRSIEGTTSESRGSGWRKVAYVGAPVTLAAIGAVVFGAIKLGPTGRDGFGFGKNCLKGMDGKPVDTPGIPVCVDGEKWQNVTYAGGIAAGVVGGLTLVAIYKGFIAKPERPPAGRETIGKSSRRRPRIDVTPVIGPTVSGATLSFEW